MTCMPGSVLIFFIKLHNNWQSKRNSELWNDLNWKLNITKKPPSLHTSKKLFNEIFKCQTSDTLGCSMFNNRLLTSSVQGKLSCLEMTPARFHHETSQVNVTVKNKWLPRQTCFRSVIVTRIPHRRRSSRSSWRNGLLDAMLMQLHPESAMCAARKP